MGILFTTHMGFLFTITMGILFTIVLGIQFTISSLCLTYYAHLFENWPTIPSEDRLNQISPIVNPLAEFCFKSEYNKRKLPVN
jgi:hypothetical protein